MKKISLLLFGGMTSCLFPLPAPGCGNGIEEGDEAITCFSFVKGPLDARNMKTIHEAVVLDFDNDKALDLAFVGNAPDVKEDVTFIQDIFGARKEKSFVIGDDDLLSVSDIAVHHRTPDELPQVLVSHANDTENNFTSFGFFQNEISVVDVFSSNSSQSFFSTLSLASSDIDGNEGEEIFFVTQGEPSLETLFEPAFELGVLTFNQQGVEQKNVDLTAKQVSGIGLLVEDLFDFNGKGKGVPDVWFLDQKIDEEDAEIEVIGDFSFEAPLSEPFFQIEATGDESAIASFDIINNRDKKEIVFLNSLSGQIGFVSMRNDGSRLERRIFNISNAAARSLTVAKLDKGDVEDVAIVENLPNGDSQVIFILNGNVNNPERVGPFKGKAATINAADVNGDKRTDFVLTFESVDGGVGEIGALLADF